MTTAAVIIPHFNDARRLERCLAALMPQVSASVEVVVVDNGSSQSLDKIRSAHPQLKIIIEPRKGAAMARNRGVAETAAKRLFFLDCDCVPASNWLETAQAVASQADLIGGTVTVFDETPPPRSGAEAFETVFAFNNKKYIEKKGFSVTANLLTKRDIFEVIGGFSAGVSEDLEWCRRATAKGFILIHEDALRVAHPTRSDWTSLNQKWRRLTVEAWGLKDKGIVARVHWAALALAMPLSILAHAPKVLTASTLRSRQERYGALTTLARLRLKRLGWMLRQAIGGKI